MSSFCANCGTATGGGKFCPKCGSPQVAGDAAAPSISQTPYVPPQKKSPVLKIVLITLAVLVMLGIAGLVKVYYVAKDVVQQARQEIAKSKNGPAQRTQAGCDLLSKDKMAEILDQKVVRVEGNEAGDLREYCNYYSTAKVASDEDKSDEEKKTDEQSKDDKPGLKDLESLAKKISAASKDRPLVSAQIYRGNAEAALIGLKTVTRLTGKGLESISGPWDEAYFGPGDTTFVVRKGENGFLLTLTLVSDKRKAGVEVAKEMIGAL